VQVQYRFGFDVHLAKEVVHTAFIKLWESRKELDNTTLLLPYLQRIVYNNCLDALKHEDVRTRYKNAVLKNATDFSEDEPVASLDTRQLEQLILRSVEALPDQMQAIFRLSRFEGLKYSEISERLGISVKTVETHMSRALTRMRTLLSGYLKLFVLLSASVIKIYLQSL
jgi:RNA polymerase sigma-70 factor (ECF subfamily)